MRPGVLIYPDVQGVTGRVNKYHDPCRAAGRDFLLRLSVAAVRRFLFDLFRGPRCCGIAKGRASGADCSPQTRARGLTGPGCPGLASRATRYSRHRALRAGRACGTSRRVRRSRAVACMGTGRREDAVQFVEQFAAGGDPLPAFGLGRRISAPFGRGALRRPGPLRKPAPGLRTSRGPGRP